jgi:hypothetical protein
MANQFKKIRIGIKDLYKPTKNLEKVVKEYLDLPNYTFLKINILKDSNLMLIIPIFLSHNNVL